ncbi:helix-turn-helix domain-containing protein [Candidatus Dojkabacteria bacterium]|nr:helix-turn-helix domain-containing protein [Candidatus Dojkabacteria bacterium]
MGDEQYYTLEEVAEMLKVTYMTVYRWIKSGQLEAVKAGKQYRVSKKCLNEFIEKSAKDE